LHASGVVIAGKRHEGAKLLHKTLDRRHRVAITQFDKAKTVEEVRATWKEAAQRGDIPGAYWAALTHPATNDGLLRKFSQMCTCCRTSSVPPIARISGVCVSWRPQTPSWKQRSNASSSCCEMRSWRAMLQFAICGARSKNASSMIATPLRNSPRNLCG
jgi:hypothetical protein